MNTIKPLFLFVEQLDQIEVCLPYSRHLAGILILAVFQNLRWNSKKTFLSIFLNIEIEKNRILLFHYIIIIFIMTTPTMVSDGILYFANQDKINQTTEESWK